MRKQIKLDPGVLHAIGLRRQLLQQKELELQLLRNELEAFLSASTGVNLATQSWTLDLEHGLLERNPRNG